MTIQKREGLRHNGADLEYARGEHWSEAALCREVDSEDFFPRQGDHAASSRAKRTCQQCPVVADCLRWALETREPHAIAGGMTARERQRLLAQRKAS